MPERLVCGCCGKYFRGEQTQEHDTGYGTCQDCMQWQVDIFVDRGLDVLLKSLNPQNQEKLKAMPRDKQEAIIFKAWDKGIISWGGINGVVE